MIKLKAKQVKNTDNYKVKLVHKHENMADYFVAINSLVARLLKSYKHISLDNIIEVIRKSNERR